MDTNTVRTFGVSSKLKFAFTRLPFTGGSDLSYTSAN